MGIITMLLLKWLAFWSIFMINELLNFFCSLVINKLFKYFLFKINQSIQSGLSPNSSPSFSS
jgi:hypothetical protein